MALEKRLNLQLNIYFVEDFYQTLDSREDSKGVLSKVSFVFYMFMFCSGQLQLDSSRGDGGGAREGGGEGGGHIHMEHSILRPPVRRYKD